MPARASARQSRAYPAWWRWGGLTAIIALLLLPCGGCGQQREPDAGQDGGAGDAADVDPKTAGQVEFSGSADALVTVSDSTGRVVFSGDTPCEARLAPGSYTWSARFRDNQRTEERSLQLLTGDDHRVTVEPPRPLLPEPGEGPPEGGQPGSGKDYNKPWLSTEPMVPTGKPVRAPVGGKSKVAPPKPAVGAPGGEGEADEKPRSGDRSATDTGRPEQRSGGDDSD